jgi:hypothetical protein
MVIYSALFVISQTHWGKEGKRRKTKKKGGNHLEYEFCSGMTELFSPPPDQFRLVYFSAKCQQKQQQQQRNKTENAVADEPLTMRWLDVILII